MQKDFELYKLDIKYIQDLHNKDDKVPSISPQFNKDSRVFIGVVDMGNSMDFSKIEVDGKLLGVLNFNLMIPVEEI